jgi:CheY-like chemotaxis protein
MLGLCCDQLGLIHECVVNGHEAVEAAQSGRFDDVLMDIFMLRMDGLTATRAIRALPGPVSAVPVIAVTRAATPGEVSLYLSCGMSHVLAGAINSARLADALSTALSPLRAGVWSEPEPELALSA